MALAPINLGQTADLSGLVPVSTFQPATFWTGKRYFGPITALMTIEERGADRLTITQHPVELGASITDHAYVEPAELQMRMMATNSGQKSALDPGSSGADYVSNLYQQLLTLQGQRQTMPIQTGKRLYQNMLITSLELTTDEKSEHALMLNIQCKEIIKVQSHVVSGTATSADVQAYPAKTAPVTETGTKQAQATTVDVPTGAAISI